MTSRRKGTIYDSLTIREGFINNKHLFVSESGEKTLYFTQSVKRPYSMSIDKFDCVSYGPVAEMINGLPDQVRVECKGYSSTHYQEIGDKRVKKERMIVNRVTPIVTQKIINQLKSMNYTGVDYEDFFTLPGEEAQKDAK